MHLFLLDKKFDIELVNEELLLKIEPGLSSYSSNPEKVILNYKSYSLNANFKIKAVDSIEPLLKRALEIIPSTYHSITRISLKATAGLRLISDEIANKILNNVNLNNLKT